MNIPKLNCRDSLRTLSVNCQKYPRNILQNMERAKIQCNICKTIFSKKAKLEWHTKDVHCSICKNYKDSSVDLSQHNERMHNKQRRIKYLNGEPQLCPECGKAPQDLPRHLKTVHEKSTTECCELDMVVVILGGKVRVAVICCI